MVERRRVVERAQDRLDPRRLDLRDPARADRRLDLVDRARRAPPPSAGKRVAQAQEGDVAVAVVRRLREHGEDQLVERPPVRRRDRHAVDTRSRSRSARTRRAGGASSRGGGQRRHATASMARRVPAVHRAHRDARRPAGLLARRGAAGPAARPSSTSTACRTRGDLWTPFLERTGGVAPDLPGFGAQRQARRPRLLDRGLRRLARALPRRSRRLDRVRLVDARLGRGRPRARRSARPSGSSGSSRSTRCRSARLPLAPRSRACGARASLGEAVMGLAVERGRHAPVPAARGRADAGPGPASTRARSGRSCACTARARPRTPRRRRRRAAARSTAPALVVHGDTRPATSPRASPTGCAAALGDGRAEHVEGAGHWPWLDRPEVVDRICGFLADD